MVITMSRFYSSEINYEKQLFSNKFGYGNLSSNLKVENYDTNKYKKFLINKFDWNIDSLHFLKIFLMEKYYLDKNINYETDNVKISSRSNE